MQPRPNRRRPEPRRGPDPAQLHVDCAVDAADELLPAGAWLPVLQARLRGARPAASAASPIRDLCLFAPGGRGASAGWPGGPGVVCAGPTARRTSAPRSWADEGADGQERPHRARGSKGGFVVKRPPRRSRPRSSGGGGVECYRIFLRGLLDLTDNYRQGRVETPERVVRYDEDDPYLVVAADKGTASFSDLANTSPPNTTSGSGMRSPLAAVTATTTSRWASPPGGRGSRSSATSGSWAPTCRARHSPWSASVTCRGTCSATGCCAPSTCGCSRLQPSAHLLDPDPDPATSYAERRRLFDSPARWSDYDPALISSGGGVLSRRQSRSRSVRQVRDALGIKGRSAQPGELIRELLRAPVDLLFNGGIGTYVKADERSG